MISSSTCIWNVSSLYSTTTIHLPYSFILCLPPLRESSPFAELCIAALILNLIWMFGCSGVRVFGCWDVGMLGCQDVWMFGCQDVRIFGCQQIVQYRYPGRSDTGGSGYENMRSFKCACFDQVSGFDSTPIEENKHQI